MARVPETSNGRFPGRKIMLKPLAATLVPACALRPSDGDGAWGGELFTNTITVEVK